MYGILEFIEVARGLQSKPGVWLRLAAVTLAVQSAHCVVAPPLVDPVIFDSAPFYFPDGLVPSPSQDVVLDLGAGERQTFSVDLYEWDPGDVLDYRWTFVSRDFSGELGSGELRTPAAINDVFVHRVQPVTVTTCGEFLRREGDVLTLRLEVVDEIPEEQRFDDSADAYRFALQWRVVASGECR